MAEIFDITVLTAYTWIKRYKENDIKSLKICPDKVINNGLLL